MGKTKLPSNFWSIWNWPSEISIRRFSKGSIIRENCNLSNVSLLLLELFGKWIFLILFLAFAHLSTLFRKMDFCDLWRIRLGPNGFLSRRGQFLCIYIYIYISLFVLRTTSLGLHKQDQHAFCSPFPLPLIFLICLVEGALIFIILLWVEWYGLDLVRLQWYDYLRLR